MMTTRQNKSEGGEEKQGRRRTRLRTGTEEEERAIGIG
jgi:hypothetical protein